MRGYDYDGVYKLCYFDISCGLGYLGCDRLYSYRNTLCYIQVLSFWCGLSLVIIMLCCVYKTCCFDTSCVVCTSHVILTWIVIGDYSVVEDSVICFFCQCVFDV